MRFKFWISNSDEQKPLNAASTMAFQFAEHLLVLGVFWFLADQTNHWAVYTIAILLMGLFFANLLAFITGLHVTHWKAGDGKMMRVFWGRSTACSFSHCVQSFGSHSMR
jgi:hypothetical protein